jgi:iron(III) transport system substrate-binding protein
MKVIFVAAFILQILSTGVWSQSAPPKTAAELAKAMGADRQRLLYECAKKEGKVVWYTSLTVYKEMAKFFEAKYPGVTVEVYRAPAMNLVSRILGETQARRYIFDAIETTPGSLMLVRDNKLLLPYNSPHLADYPEGSKDKAPGGLFFTTVDRESYAGIGYNKNAIPSAIVPKNFDDLLSPAPQRQDRRQRRRDRQPRHRRDAQSKRQGFVKKLAAQDIKHYALPALGLNELVVSGEVPLTFTAVDSNVRLAAGRGAPVAWLPGDLVPTNAGSLAASVNTQRPHATLLFIDLLIGPEGQKLLSEKFGYGSPRKEYGFKRWYPEQGLSSYEYAQTIERWNKLLLQIARK